MFGIASQTNSDNNYVTGPKKLFGCTNKNLLKFTLQEARYIHYLTNVRNPIRQKSSTSNPVLHFTFYINELFSFMLDKVQAISCNSILVLMEAHL